MALNSMTGFARASGEFADWTWSWELKSVNAKGLDIRFRTPSGFDGLEPQARARLSKRFQRGSLNAGLMLVRRSAGASYRINETQLDSVIEAARSLSERYPEAAAPSVDGLLNVRGVIEAEDEGFDEDLRRELEQLLLESLESAASDLAQAREEEGARLAGVLNGFVQTMSELRSRAMTTADVQPDVLRARLNDQLAKLMDDVSGFEPGRLEQELALLLSKADVTEELDRYQAHIAAIEELLAGGGAIGRRLDFLCQELNREANTICSKAQDITLTRIGLDMKASIEQFREQVQNIE